MLKYRRVMVSKFLAVMGLAAGILVGFAISGTWLPRVTEGAPGDKLREFDPGGITCPYGSSVAFDGTQLYLTCWGSNVIYRVSPVDGSALGSNTMTGLGEILTLAWDKGREKLWACVNNHLIYSIDVTTFTAQLIFDSVPPATQGTCKDGLAYDASDDSLWMSGDGDSEIYHFTTSGTLLTTFIPGAVVGGNHSGLAVGGDTLYVANPNTADIYACTKTFSSCSVVVTSAAPPGHPTIEELECDSETFAPKDVLWNVSQGNPYLTAWEVPTGTCGTGGGPAPTCAQGEPNAGASASSAQCHDVDVRICYGGSAPTGGVLGCNGGSETLVPVSTILTQYTLQNMPVGHRLADCGAHFVRDLNCGRSLSVTYSPSPWGYSTPVGNWGDIYGVVDLGCNITSDVLAGFGGLGGPPIGWPNPATWAPFTTSQVVTPAWMNDGDSRLVPPSFTVLGTEQAMGTYVWFNGIAPAATSPYPWTLATAQSPYPSAAGLKLTWNVIGDPTKPPNVSDFCVDSRWAHVHMNNAQWTSPAAAGLYPRWTIVQTMQDIRSGIIHRTVDLHCVGVAPVPADADADCLSDAADLNDFNPDQDGDLLVDGIDVANGSNPAAADTDADGASDFDELFTFTDPTDTDTDNDGQGDRPDHIAISGAGNTGDLLEVIDDNCPAVANANQLNTDSLEYASGGAHYGDRTQPQQDWMGDVCDRDMDNDHLYNVTEAVFLMSGLNCLSGSGATTNAMKADNDLSVPSSPNGADQAVDGAECALGANPLTHLTTFVACNATTDSDVDRLCYHPGGVGGSASRENFWRTRDISGFPAELEHACAPPPRIPGCIDTFIGETDRDSDGDGLPDGTEVKYYATNPSNADTDNDSCPDGKEVADISGDGNTNSGDQGLLASAISVPPPVWDPIRINKDMTKEGLVNSGDQGFLASFIALGGGACPARTGIVITKSRQ